MADEGRAVVTLRDYDGQAGAVTVRCPAITAVNFTDQETAFDEWRAALMTLAEGSLSQHQHGNFELISTDRAASETAQRRHKWKVNYTDDVTSERYFFTIPCPQHTYLDPNNRTKILMTDGDVADFVAKTEAFVLSPDGNAITVVDIELVQ